MKKKKEVERKEKKGKAVEAKKVILASPLIPTQYPPGFKEEVKSRMLGCEFEEGERYDVTIDGKAFSYAVEKTIPDERVRITDKTLVLLPLTRQEWKDKLSRTVVNGFYDFQEVRISSVNRLRPIIRALNEGLDLTHPEEKKEEKEKAHGKYADENLLPLVEEMHAKKKISEDEFEYLNTCLNFYKQANALEGGYATKMEKILENEPVWRECLSKVKGIGFIIASNILKNFGYCERYPHVSSLWKHVGYAGGGQKLQRGVKADFNPKLRVLCWKIGDMFVKHRSEPYRTVYDREKERQLFLLKNNPDDPTAPKRPKHAELRARRKAVKIFLQHYWVAARQLKKLPISEPYVVDKLHHKTSRLIKPPWDK